MKTRLIAALVLSLGACSVQDGDSTPEPDSEPDVRRSLDGAQGDVDTEEDAPSDVVQEPAVDAPSEEDAVEVEDAGTDTAAEEDSEPDLATDDTAILDAVDVAGPVDLDATEAGDSASDADPLVDPDILDVSDDETKLDEPTEEVAPDPCVDMAPPGGCQYGGDLTIETAFALNAFADTGCTSIEGDLVVRGNETVSDLAELSTVQWIGGDLLIDDSEQLQDVDGLGNLVYVGGLILIGHAAEESYPSTADQFGNQSLTSLDGLSAVQCVGADVLIIGNPALTSIDLTGLTEVHGDFWIFYNDVTDLSGLTNLRAVDGDVVIFSFELTDLEGLSSLQRVGGDLLLGTLIPNLWRTNIRFWNWSLSNVNGLRNLATIGGSLHIEGYEDDSILETVGGEEDGLNSSLEEIGGDLVITDNPLLPTCEVQYLRDRLAFISGLGGTATISGNNDAATCSFYP